MNDGFLGAYVSRKVAILRELLTLGLLQSVRRLAADEADAGT